MDESLTVTDIGKFIDSYGWKYANDGENLIAVAFKGEISDTEFHLIIEAFENWLSLTIWPYLFPFPPEKKLEALEDVCKVNFDLHMARLAMKSSGEIALCLDLPMSSLTESSFHNALDVITYYADVLFPRFVKYWDKE
jgi:hypothetical protein